MHRFLLGVLLFALGPLAAFAQIPDQVKTFRKALPASATSSTYEWQGCSAQLQEIMALSAGHFDTGKQAADAPLFRHIYRAVPLNTAPIDGKYWFYEEIALGVEASKPFSQRVFSYEEDAVGNVYRRYYYDDQLEAYPNAWKDLAPLKEALHLPNLMELAGCAIRVQAQNKGWFYLRQDDLSCQDPLSGDKSYIRYEFYLFEGGLAIRPLAHDAQGRLVWGTPEHWYLTERQSLDKL